MTLPALPFLFLLVCLQVTGKPQAKTPYRYFGSKTSYFVNAGLDQRLISVPGCVPEMFWFVGRHGARNPDREWTGEMSSRLPIIRDRIVAAWLEGRGQLIEGVIQKLREWRFAPKMEEALQLTGSGRKEHEEMGKRWRTRLGHVLEDRRKILVRATKEDRTRESAKFFLKGLFEEKTEKLGPINNRALTVPPSPERENDSLLRFFENCPKYTKDVLNNNKTVSERHKLEQSDEYRDMLDEVRDKLGVNISSSDILWIWQICGFEMSWWPNEDSSWCQLFTDNNLKILEYAEDLTNYYRLAYAHDINWKITQPLFSDIFNKFEAVWEGQSNYTGILYFAHLETIAPLLAALGLYRDQRDLLASDWPNLAYKWMSSRLASFSANVGLVLLRCEAQSEHFDLACRFCRGREHWKVMAMHQEKRVKLPACEEELCSMDEFLDYYGNLEMINFQNMCNVN